MIVTEYMRTYGIADMRLVLALPYYQFEAAYAAMRGESPADVAEEIVEQRRAEVVEIREARVRLGHQVVG